MATSEPLVPTGLPQGSRQEVREGMQRAGMPLAPPQLSGGSPGGFTSSTQAPATGSTGGPLDFMLEHGPEDFPFIADQQPDSSEPAAPRSVIQALTESSQSEFGRAVAMRLQQSQRR